MSSLRLLIRPTIFTGNVCLGCGVAAAIWHHENKRTKGYYARQWVQSMKTIRQNSSWKVVAFRQRVNEWKNNLTTGEKVVSVTIFINALVLGAWRIPRLTPVMTKFFLCRASTTKISLSPMILSCFSHSNLVHFALNMYVAHSFANYATSLLGPEQLAGLFISAGAASSLASLAFKLARGVYHPSLGASGALLGVIAYISTVCPNTNLYVFFVPAEANNALMALMAIDVIGMVLGWRYLDHAAHFGGCLFGIWYAKYGQSIYERYKKPIGKRWNKCKQAINTRQDE